MKDSYVSIKCAADILSIS